MIKALIFDYGGTLDASGDHWSEVIFDQYREVCPEIDYDTFADAYVYAERYLATHPIIRPSDTFEQVMRDKITLQFDYIARLDAYDPRSEIIAMRCYKAARENIEKVRGALEELTAMFPSAIVSNFYGNLNTVLDDFDIRKYFKTVVESATVGIRKPDPRIFSLGCFLLNTPPENVLVIGDSVQNDIEPAKSIGCNTALVQGRQWRRAFQNQK